MFFFAFGGLVNSLDIDGLARLVAGSRRTMLRAVVGGVLVAGWQSAGLEGSARRRKRKQKKKRCTSRCEGRCCKSGTRSALLFAEDGFGCTCCPKQRIWSSSVEGKRCCPPGTRAMDGFTTDGGPCCAEDQYCNGECCNDGYTCDNGECVEECATSSGLKSDSATGGSSERRDVTAESAPCAWPGNTQLSCIDGYICTERFVCCRPEDTPCGGYPGQHGGCCTPDKTCNPDYDADPDNYDGPTCLAACAA